MKKKSIENTFVEVDGQQIPAKIYREMRLGWRFSIPRKGAVLRMPIGLSKQEDQKMVEKFHAWVKEKVSGSKGLQEQFAQKHYKTGDTLTVGHRHYLLQIEFTDNKTHTGKLGHGIIHLNLTRHDNDLHRQKAIRHLLSRIVAQDFQMAIEKRVADLNLRHFQKPVRSVNLKYNLTNWGSCSSKNNLNLSTRLLFAPDEVIDYVIIHELAHLVEMNHSDRFWNLVAAAMPDYREKEIWLKENWRVCDF